PLSRLRVDSLPLCSMIRRLPISPLFPYTTLFRSRIREGGRRSRRQARPQPVGSSAPSSDSGAGKRVSGAGGHIQGGKRRARQALDRKSTRLNSSHVSISYAVFCLKKKKSAERQHA